MIVFLIISLNMLLGAKSCRFLTLSMLVATSAKSLEAVIPYPANIFCPENVV